MEKSLIQNFNELATTENRKLALEIINSGLNAINTVQVVSSAVSLNENILSIQGTDFDLKKFKRIKVVGFGKSAGSAAVALEKILGARIEKGIVIGIDKIECAYIETFTGTHPRPSEINAFASEKIYKILEDSNEEDLIITLVSGGGSAILCYPESECTQGRLLYDAFLKTGKTITEINTVRKHLSLLKGGGLAKVAYPATVVGLIFSDIPGDAFENVASGPTYRDTTTKEDAEKIIVENNLGEFNLLETPKEDKYFEKVHNFVLVSNKTAVEAMSAKARELGLMPKIISTEMYDEVNTALDKIFAAQGENTVVLSAGEPRIMVDKNGGKGGRNLHMGLSAIKKNLIDADSVFVSFASDGMDNSDVAGAIVDKNTLTKVQELNLDVEDYLNRFDSYTFFQKTGAMLITGPTDSNVSDLMLLLTKK